MKFTLKEKMIRRVNKLPKPIVVMLGLMVCFSASNVGDYIWRQYDMPKFVSVITWMLIYGIGITIWFSPKEYQLLKTFEEDINEKDERNKFIINKARAKSMNVLQWIFAAFFLVCSVIEDMQVYCLLWGGLIIIQIFSEVYFKKRLEKEF